MSVTLASEVVDAIVTRMQITSKHVTYKAGAFWRQLRIGQDVTGDCKTWTQYLFDLLANDGVIKDQDMFIGLCKVPPCSVRNHCVLLVDTDTGWLVCSMGFVVPQKLLTVIADYGWTDFAYYLHDRDDNMLQTLVLE